MSKQSSHLQVYTSAHQHIGYFDGEFFYTTPPVPFRVDGQEVYTTSQPCQLVGYFIENNIKLLDGSISYVLKD